MEPEHGLVVGVEDVRTVAVDVDALHRFGVDIAGNMIALIDHKAGLARLFGFVCKHSAVKASANDQVIVLLHGSRPLFVIFPLQRSFSAMPNIYR